MARLIWLAIAVLTVVQSLSAQVAAEYPLKAAVLYNLAAFVVWPVGSFANAHDPIAVCVLGQNPFGQALDEAVRGKTAGDRSLVARRVSTAQQARQCHVLFVSSSERNRLTAVIADLEGASVLTVGETDDFIASGGIVSLKLDGERVRMDIDPEAAGRAGLRVSSKLLSLANRKK